MKKCLIVLLFVAFNLLAQNGVDSSAYTGSAIDSAITKVRNLSISVKDYGAVGDGVSDDTDEINSAISALTSKGSLEGRMTIVFPGGVGYLTDSTITIPENINVQMDAPIIADHEGVGLIVGSTTAYNNHSTLKLQVKKEDFSDWSDEGSTGIIIYNASMCTIDIPLVALFTVGVKFYGISTKGFAYCNITLGYISGNKYGLDLCSSANGWVNENLFIGGRFNAYDVSHSDRDRYGVRLGTTGANFGAGHNVFLKPSFELGDASLDEGVESVGMLFDNANNTEVISCRSETTVLVARFSGESTENRIDMGYNDGVTSEHYEDLSDNPTNVVIPSRKKFLTEMNGTVLDVPNLAEVYAPYSGAKVHFVGLSMINSTGSVANAHVTSVTKDGDYITIPSSPLVIVGAMVATQHSKSFVFYPEYDSSSTGGICVVKCYDADGAVLGNAGDVKGSAYNNFTYYSGNVGGAWYPSTSTAPIFFKVSDDVKKIFVGVARFDKMKGFSVKTLDYDTTPAISSGLVNKGLSTKHMAIQAPSKGTWEVGATFYDDTPTASGYLGWICTVAGTQGTLSGITGGITSGTDQLTVNSTTGLTVGDYITIVGVSGSFNITDIASLVVTLDSNADATVSSAAVAYSAATFKTFGAISP